MALRRNPPVPGMNPSEIDDWADLELKRLNLENSKGQLSYHEYLGTRERIKRERETLLHSWYAKQAAQANLSPIVINTPHATYMPQVAAPAPAPAPAQKMILMSGKAGITLVEWAEKQWPDLKEIETSFGEITAFRVWLLNENGLLTSTFMIEVEWQPGAILQSHDVPSPTNGDGPWRVLTSERVGIHAWKSVMEVVEYGKYWQVRHQYYDIGSRRTYDREPQAIVIGRVKLWGEVMEHSRGYRAQYAKIASIDDCRNADGEWDGETLDRLQNLYFPKRRDTSAI